MLKPIIRPAAAVLLAAAVSHGFPASPVLAVSIDHAISRPGRNGRCIERPLFLIISKWQTDAPAIRARSFSGRLTAHCSRLPSSGEQWKAEVQYEAQQENEPAFTGRVKLELAINDGIVRGTYEGSFHETTFRGRAGAGLVFERDFDSSDHGLLLWMPHLHRKLRGIVICGNGGELEKREAALVEETQAFAAGHDLAIVGTAGMRSGVKGGDGDAILQGLRDFAAMTGHPELEAAPVFFMGHSGGGSMSAEFNQWLPSRVGGYISSDGGGPRQLSKNALENPGLYTAGENDPKVRPLFIESTFVWLRLEGARISLVVEQGEQHPMGEGAMPLYLYTLERLVEQRLPAGATELKPIDETQAWVADNATWKHGITRIMPIAKAGDTMRVVLPPDGLHRTPVDGHVSFETLPSALRLSWLLDKDVAYVYRGSATYSNPLRLVRADDHGPAYSPGETVRLECKDFGPGTWKSVRLYDGAVLVGEVTPAKPVLTLSRQNPGAHAGVLVGEMANAELRTSLPVLWSVWP